MRMIIQPSKIKFEENHAVRSCIIQRFTNSVFESETELWFKLDINVPKPQDQDCDSYLLATIMDAMKEGRELHIKGSVSKTLLSNLTEYQAAWTKWKPQIYKKIEIYPDTVRQNEAPQNGAICAFSGGVDATFSVWRHSQSKVGYRNQNIVCCAIVHGFDIGLKRTESFNTAKKRAQETLDDIGIKLLPIATNYREISGSDWEDSFSCALVAALSNYKYLAGTCIIGSSEPYDFLVIPWGSSPITDHLLSSGEFSVIHDGASHNRTEKVREITDWTRGITNLRVCWEGEIKDRNCGSCEKCIRTKLNFLAINANIPPCFPVSTLIPDLKKVKLSNTAVRAEWQQIYDFAINHGVRDDWVKILPKIIAKRSAIETIFPEKSKRRIFIKKFLKQLI